MKKINGKTFRGVLEWLKSSKLKLDAVFEELMLYAEGFEKRGGLIPRRLFISLLEHPCDEPVESLYLLYMTLRTGDKLPYFSREDICILVLSLRRCIEDLEHVITIRAPIDNYRVALDALIDSVQNLEDVFKGLGLRKRGGAIYKDQQTFRDVVDMLNCAEIELNKRKGLLYILESHVCSAVNIARNIWVYFNWRVNGQENKKDREGCKENGEGLKELRENG